LSPKLLCVHGMTHPLRCRLKLRAASVSS